MQPDWRNIRNGNLIPSVNYCDQPYVVITDDNAWLCCITTGSGNEGAKGQHVATMRSLDKGKSWSTPISVEPDCPLENSYAVLLKAPSGRIFIFYNHNTDDIQSILSHDGKTTFTRVDSLGHFVFKYSDDNGLSWSSKRYDIPLRNFLCDTTNVYQGKLRFFWNVGRAFTRGGDAYIPLIKVGKMGTGFFAQSEGALLLSHNMLTEPDPERITFETLPDGDVGLRTPPGGGPISEEQSYVVMSDGSLCATYRSIDGYPVETYSRDGGHTWEESHYKQFADGRRIKHPRAANFIWKCKNGKYLYWFHNHGGHFIRDMWDNPNAITGGLSPYDDRNPVWLSGGIEADSPQGKIILWSEPEIVLYDPDPQVRMSYPDLIEDDGEYYLTETQKTIARSHRLDKSLLEKMWNGLEGKLPRPQADFTCAALTDKLPKLPMFTGRDGHHGGVTFILNLLSLRSETPLVDCRNDYGYGYAISINHLGQLELTLSEPWLSQTLTSQPLPHGTQICGIIIDADASIVSFVADGHFLDGGEQRQFGFQWLAPQIRHVNWARHATVSEDVLQLQIFNRALSINEACAIKA